jgi:hypothetical protein
MTRAEGFVPRPSFHVWGTVTFMRTRSRLGALAMILGLLTSSLTAQPASAADTTSDIPGVPLPAPVVSGALGGPIYDVVYRLTVPPGRVILAGLTGTAGTDFDLYLFDASATSVVSDAGLLTKSIGLTSDEELSWVSRFGGTYYLDLNGATDVEGTYRLSVQIVPDQSPPTAKLLIVGGATRVNTQQITLQLITFDDLSGVTEMSLSADGVNYLPPVPLQNLIPWILPEGDGLKHVWVRVYNGTGLVSAPASVTVELDTAAPTVATIDPPTDSVVGVARPTIAVRFDEAMDPATWTSTGLVVQAPSGGIVPGTYAYYPSIATGTFTPSADLALGLTYLVTVGDVRDVAGNRVGITGSWTLKRLAPTSVSLVPSATVLVYGDTVGLTGTADVPSGEPVALEARLGGATDFTVVDEIVPQDGRLDISLVPSSNTTYRATYAGSATASRSNSSEIRVLVRRKVVLQGPGPATTRSATAGQPVTLTAQLSPGGVATVSFRLYRFDPALRTYRYAGSFGRKSDASGRATMTWTPSVGSFYWRVSVPSTIAFTNNLTAPYRWRVR